MFKNAIVFKVTPGFRFDASLLERQRFVECGPTDKHSAGFIEPCAHSTGVLTHTVAGHQLICWQSQDKILPSTVILEAVQEKTEAIEEQQGYRPGRKQAREIREQVELELLPRAFTQKRQTLAVIAGDYFIINTSSKARADSFIESIKIALGSLPLGLVKTANAPAAMLRQWFIDLGDLPEHIDVGNDATLERATKERPQVRYTRTDILSADAQQKVIDGWSPTKVSITYADRISFCLADDLQITRIQLLDCVTTPEVETTETFEAKFDADITLFIGELVTALDYLIEAFGGIASDDEDLLTEEPLATTITAADDGLYEQAKAIVLAEKRVSISGVQRHLRIGYNHAARLVERMEAEGIVTALDAKGLRSVA